MPGFWGFVTLGGTIKGCAQAKNTSTGAPVNADALPTFRTYGDSGSLSGAAGTTTFKDSGSITGATNTNPIVITSVAHGLTNGTRVTITGVGGNTNANTTATVANKTADTFELSGVAGNSNYTTGGTWNVTGLYQVSIDATGGNGFEAGKTYTVLVQWAVSSTNQAELFSFTCV